MLEILGQIMIVAGGIVFLSAALGVVRFPDAYTRMSAVGTAAGLGIVLVILGALLMDPSLSATLKVVIIIGLQLATSSVGTMAIARSAYLTGSPMRVSGFEELADADRERHADETDRKSDPDT